MTQMECEQEEASVGDDGYIGVQLPIIFIKQLSIFCCVDCKICISSVEGISSHLQPRTRHGLTPGERQHILDAAYQIRQKQGFQPPQGPIPVIPYLNPHQAGRRCTLCPHVAVADIDKHAREHHRGARVPKEGLPVRVQQLWKKAPQGCPGYVEVDVASSGCRSSSGNEQPPSPSLGIQLPDEQRAAILASADRVLSNQADAISRCTLADLDRTISRHDVATGEGNSWVEYTRWPFYHEGRTPRQVLQLLAPVQPEEEELAAVLAHFDSFVRWLFVRAGGIAERNLGPSIAVMKRINSSRIERWTGVDAATEKKYARTFSQAIVFLQRTMKVPPTQGGCASQSREEQDRLYCEIAANIGSRKGAPLQIRHRRTQPLTRMFLRLVESLFSHVLLKGESESVIYGTLATMALTDTGTWRPARGFTPHLAAFLKIIRTSTLVLADDRHREALYPRSIHENVAEIVDSFLVSNKVSTPATWLSNALAMGRSIPDKNPTPILGLWIEDSDNLRIGRCTLHLSVVQKYAQHLTWSLESLTSELLHMGDQGGPKAHPEPSTALHSKSLPEIPWHDILDDHTILDSFASFIGPEAETSRTRGALPGKPRWLLRRILDDPRHCDYWFSPPSDVATAPSGYRDVAVRTYNQLVDRFLRVLSVAFYFLCGQPPRTTELVSLRWCNGLDGVRNIAVHNSSVFTVTYYSKNFRQTGREKPVYRMLPPRVAHCFVYYLWLVLPFHHIINTPREGYESKPNPFIFTNTPTIIQASRSRSLDQPSDSADTSLDSDCELDGLDRTAVTTGERRDDRLDRHGNIDDVDDDGSSSGSDDGADDGERQPPGRSSRTPVGKASLAPSMASFPTGGAKAKPSQTPLHWPGAAFCRMFKVEAGTHLDPECGVRVWRHASLDFFYRYLSGITVEEEGKEVRHLDPLFHLQAAHSRETGETKYGQLVTQMGRDLKDEELMLGFGTVSSLVHGLFLGEGSSRGGTGRLYDEEQKLRPLAPNLSRIHEKARRRRLKSLAEVDWQPRLVNFLNLGNAVRPAFRPTQLETIQAVARGDSFILQVAATGAGKSLSFELVAAACHGGITVVVVPLLALQVDLAGKCKAGKIGVHIFDPDERTPLVPVILVTPERFVGRSFRSFLSVIGNMKLLDRVVLDEAHVLLDAHADFRPDVLKLADVIADHGAQFLCLTATLPPKLREIFFKRLKIHPNQFTIIRGSTRRPDIRYAVVFTTESHLVRKAETMVKQRMKEFARFNYKAVVFCRRIDQAKDLATRLQALLYFAGSGTYEERMGTLDAFRNMTSGLLVASSAFAEGSDIAGINATFHVNAFPPLHTFIQASGRAARTLPFGVSTILLTQSVHSGYGGTVGDLGRTTECRRLVLDSWLDGEEQPATCLQSEQPTIPCDICDPDWDELAHLESAAATLPATLPARPSVDHRSAKRGRPTLPQVAGSIHHQRRHGPSCSADEEAGRPSESCSSPAVDMLAQRQQRHAKAIGDAERGSMLKELFAYNRQWCFYCVSDPGIAEFDHPYPSCKHRISSDWSTVCEQIRDSARQLLGRATKCRSDYGSCSACHLPQAFCLSWVPGPGGANDYRISPDGKNCQKSPSFVFELFVALYRRMGSLADPFIRSKAQESIKLSGEVLCSPSPIYAGDDIGQWLNQVVRAGHFQSTNLCILIAEMYEKCSLHR